MDFIANLVVGELPVDPGKQLGARLLKAHQMTLLEGREVKPVPTSGRGETVGADGSHGEAVSEGAGGFCFL